MSNTVTDLLIQRKSVRAFTDKEITAEDKELILTCAVQAPTAGNQQLYTILDITDPSLQAALAESCDHQPFIAEAKMILIFCADCRKWYEAFRDAGCEPREPGVGDFLLAVDDALIAAQNAQVAAESLGIGSCYIGDIMENYELHREMLHLPEYVFPAAMLVFGYPAQSQIERQKPERAPMSSIVFENRYPDMGPQELHALFENKTRNMDLAALKKIYGDAAIDRRYAAWMQAFCQRKYNSAFAREMSRSAAAFMKQFKSTGSL